MKALIVFGIVAAVAFVTVFTGAAVAVETASKYMRD